MALYQILCRPRSGLGLAPERRARSSPMFRSRDSLLPPDADPQTIYQSATSIIPLSGGGDVHRDIVMAQLPAHASPALTPTSSPRSHFNHQLPDFHLDQSVSTHQGRPPPPAIISPAFTPPSTPGTGTPALDRAAHSIPIDHTNHGPTPQLLERLPKVNCIVRARIPTTTGQEMYLHLYQNDSDNKEHLAIVFGTEIRSRSLDAVHPGESELDRMIRGAYTGRLYPGRTTSRLPGAQASPLHRSLHKPSLLSPSASLTTSSVSHRPIPSSTSLDASIDESSSASCSARCSATPQSSTAPTSPLVRIHSECYTGETVWSARCDCGEQLDEAARLMSLPSASPSPGGVIVYLRQEGRGIGLGEKLKAYNLQDLGSDTVEANLLLRHPADARSYGLATAMLIDLGCGGERGIRLLTNNPEKVRAVEGPRQEVVVKERVEMVPLAWKSGGKVGVRSEEVGSYLRTKVSWDRLSERIVG